MVCAILKFATAPLNNTNFFYAFAFSIGHALILKVGIKLKISQIVGLIEGYNLSKFQIDSLQIKVRTSFFVWQKFLKTVRAFICAILKFATAPLKNMNFFYAFVFVIGQT